MIYTTFYTINKFQPAIRLQVNSGPQGALPSSSKISSGLCPTRQLAASQTDCCRKFLKQPHDFMHQQIVIDIFTFVRKARHM